MFKEKREEPKVLQNSYCTKHNKKGVSALIATVLLILITIAGVAIIAGAVIPMITKITQSGQACTGARLNIDTSAGFTCYSDEKKQASIMVSRGAEDFDLVGIQLGLSSAGTTKSVTIKEGSPAVASWGFDEGSGNTAYDSSGNGNDGTINGAIFKSGTNCISGSCLSFDGVNDYVNVGNGASLSITNTITIAAWVNALSLPPTASQSIVDSSIDHSAQRKQLLYIGGNQIHYGFGSSYWTTTNANLQPNTWYHIALVFDKTLASENIKVYLNGVKIDNRDYTLSLPTGSTTTIGNALAVSRPFNGTIDEVKIYNRVLSEDEIKAQYQADKKSNKIIYSSLPMANSANTYRINTENISEVQVAPIVKVGNTEKICDISAKITSIPKCTS